MSLTLTAKATDPPPAVMHSMLVWKDPKTNKNVKTQTIMETTKTKIVYWYANISRILFDQKSPINQEAGLRNGTHRNTDRHTDYRQTLQLRDRLGLE